MKKLLSARSAALMSLLLCVSILLVSCGNFAASTTAAADTTSPVTTENPQTTTAAPATAAVPETTTSPVTTEGTATTTAPAATTSVTTTAPVTTTVPVTTTIPVTTTAQVTTAKKPATTAAPKKTTAAETTKAPDTEPVVEENVIDMYLIGGQSNAVGYSNKGNLSGVFDNVWFAGENERNRTTGAVAFSMINEYSKCVKTGFGLNANCIGPEYGMAEVLNDFYSNGHPAFIYKYAAGGTALHNDTWGLSDTFGNWYPKSRWGNATVDASASPMGVLYYNFLENFKTVYNKLKADGYTPKIKGMVWMQGEADLGREASYKVLLKALIKSLRADLAEITGDDSCLEMPFVIGKIATTFETYDNPNVPAFNKVQQAVADSMTNVYTIETSDLVIVSESGLIKGTDKYHFNTEDARTLGNRFAEKLLEHYGKK